MNTRNLLGILIATVLGIGASVNAASILWVTEDTSINGDWNNLLTGAGHTVTGYTSAADNPDPTAGGAPYTVAQLNAFDLIIAAGSNDSSGIGDNASVWNSLTAPILAMGVYSLDAGTSPDWAWFESNSGNSYSTTSSYLDTDPIFDGIDPTVTKLFTDNTMMANPIIYKSGVELASYATFIQIARWEAGTVGVDAGKRMFFAGKAGSGFERDDFHLTAEGETVFLNAINSLIGSNIPEPSTMILAGLGLAGMCLRRRRRK